MLVSITYLNEAESQVPLHHLLPGAGGLPQDGGQHGVRRPHQPEEAGQEQEQSEGGTGKYDCFRKIIGILGKRISGQYHLIPGPQEYYEDEE